MRIYILDPEGNAIDHSAEQLPARWRSAIVETINGIPNAPPAEDILGGSNEFLIQWGGQNPDKMIDGETIAAYLKWSKGTLTIEEDGQMVDALDFIKRCCIAGWMFDETILANFDRKAAIANGYVKITMTGLEYGWLEHDGLHRLVM